MPPETPQSDSRVARMAHVAVSSTFPSHPQLNGMDAAYSEYCQALLGGYIDIDGLRRRLPGRVPMMQDVLARLTAPLDMATKLEAVAQRHQGLMEMLRLARAELAAHAGVEALEAQLREAGTPLRLADRPRQIQLQTTFDLTDFRWLGTTKYFHDSPKRIQVVLLDDLVLVTTPKNEALLVWARVEDLRAIPLSPRAGDPLGKPRPAA